METKTKAKDKHMIKGTSLIIRKMQMRVTTRKQYLTIRLAETEKKNKLIKSRTGRGRRKTAQEVIEDVNEDGFGN